MEKNLDFWCDFLQKVSFDLFCLFFLNVRHKSKKKAPHAGDTHLVKRPGGSGNKKKARRRARGGASVTCLALKATRAEKGASRTTSASWHEKRGTERNARIQSIVESKH